MSVHVSLLRRVAPAAAAAALTAIALCLPAAAQAAPSQGTSVRANEMIEYLFVDRAPAAQPMSAYISVQCFGGHFKNWEGPVGVGFGGITSMGSGYCPGGSVIVVRPVARLQSGGRGGEACEVTAVDIPDGQKQLLIWFKELREENGQIRCAVETELPDVLNP